MTNDYIFIDLDGVILDSEKRMLERKYDLGLRDHKNEEEFGQYFEYTNLHPEEWNYILKEAKPINNSVEIIKELESLKRKIAILTKIHTLQEMKVKMEVLRENQKITCPVIFVPPGVKKHQMIIPNTQLLVDDSPKNINSWIENGGVGLIFDPSIDHDTYEKVRSLEFLIKR